MKTRYGNKVNFWIANIDNKASFTWENMLKCRDLCKYIIIKEIANGKDAHLWFDTWYNGGNLVSKKVDKDYQQLEDIIFMLTALSAIMIGN